MSNTYQTQRSAEIVSNLREYVGTEHYYKYLGGIVLTDGARAFAEQAGAFWFLDIVASYQHIREFRKQPFQTWRLLKLGASQATVTCEDGMGRLLCSQDIPYTDFPLHVIDLFLVDDGSHRVLMLTSEY